MMGADYDSILDDQVDKAPLTPEDLARHPLTVPVTLGGERCLLHYTTCRTGGRVILARTPEALLRAWQRVVGVGFGLRSILRIEMLAPAIFMREAYARRQRQSAAEEFWVRLGCAAERHLAAHHAPPVGLSLCPFRRPQADGAGEEAGDGDYFDPYAHGGCVLCRFGWVPTEHLGRIVSEWAANFYLARRHHPGLGALSGDDTPTAPIGYKADDKADDKGSRARVATDQEAVTVLRAAWIEAGAHARGVCLSDAPLGPFAASHEPSHPLFFYREVCDLDATAFRAVVREAEERRALTAAQVEANRRAERSAERSAEAARASAILAAILANTQGTQDTP